MFKEERGSAPLGIREGISDTALKMENEMFAKAEGKKAKSKTIPRRQLSLFGN